MESKKVKGLTIAALVLSAVILLLYVIPVSNSYVYWYFSSASINSLPDISEPTSYMLVQVPFKAAAVFADHGFAMPILWNLLFLSYLLPIAAVCSLVILITQRTKKMLLMNCLFIACSYVVFLLLNYGGYISESFGFLASSDISSGSYSSIAVSLGSSLVFPLLLVVVPALLVVTAILMEQLPDDNATAQTSTGFSQMTAANPVIPTVSTASTSSVVPVPVVPVAPVSAAPAGPAAPTAPAVPPAQETPAASDIPAAPSGPAAPAGPAAPVPPTSKP